MNTITVNGERYKAILTSFLWSKLEEVDLDNEATCNIVNATFELLPENFKDSIISSNCHIEWLPKRFDLILLDYFL